MEEESWRRNHGDESWRMHHGGGIMDEAARRRQPGEGTRRHPGAPGAAQETPGAPRAHPGSTQEEPGGTQETARQRHPGDTQEVPRALKAPEASEKEE